MGAEPPAAWRGRLSFRTRRPQRGPGPQGPQVSLPAAKVRGRAERDGSGVRGGGGDRAQRVTRRRGRAGPSDDAAEAVGSGRPGAPPLLPGCGPGGTGGGRVGSRGLRRLGVHGACGRWSGRPGLGGAGRWVRTGGLAPGPPERRLCGRLHPGHIPRPLPDSENCQGTSRPPRACEIRRLPFPSHGFCFRETGEVRVPRELAGRVGAVKASTRRRAGQLGNPIGVRAS